ncbi:MAG: tRNA-dihydrouridine synthase [Clostridia bacterium]|nr:tRNA-dihydrouridine synthase [Clostridia bacterium]
MPNIISSLAPMAGYTDAAFRRICSEFGADYAVSEMISSMAMVMGDRKTADLAKIHPGEAPVVLQIFGHDPDVMAKSADMLLSGDYHGCSYAAKPAGIDINMGCPVKKIVSNGEGSALMKNTDLACRIISAVAEVCAKYSVPLSVKHRLGWDSTSINAADFAYAAARAGASKITLHTRTREQMYAPSADPSVCREVSARLRELGVPLVGNGDIETLDDAEAYLDFGCSEVSVGRAALGNPWIFRQLKEPDTFTPPSLDEVIDLVIRFVTELVAEKGEAVGIRESRGRAAYFIHGMRGSAKIRDRLNHSNTLDEFVSVLNEIKNTVN